LPAFAEPLCQGGELVRAPREASGQLAAAEFVDVRLVDEVEVRLEVREDVEEPVPERGDGRREATGQLFERLAELSGAARVDHAEDRLGPGQVDPPREERPEGELARLGQPRPARQAVGEQELQERRRAERVDLGGGLAGVRPRARPERERCRQRGAEPVERVTPRAPFGPARQGGLDVGREPHQGDRPCRRPAQPHDPPEPEPRRARDRRDRVGRVKMGHREGVWR
jgi:hypothetical protein